MPFKVEGKNKTPPISILLNKQLSLPAHALTCEAVTQELEVDLTYGLSYDEVHTRFEQYGKNELNDGPSVQPFKIFMRQIANAMMLVLLLAMAVSLGIGSWIEGGVIAAVFVLNIIVGFYQEFNAEKTMDSLRSLSSPTASVVRKGKSETIPSTELVPGDMVELKTGDTVPTDIRLAEAMNFEIDESLLTGESLPVQKNAKVVLDVDIGPGDRLNIAFSSSVVTKGRAHGLVFATGMKTEVGGIAAALRAKHKKVIREVRRNSDGQAHPLRYFQAWGLTAGDFVGHFLGINVGTPLQRKLSKLAILLFGVAVVCAMVVLAANQFSNKKEVIIYAVATGLSMIPACLVVVLTITMAAGTKRMAESHVIIRKSDSLEALGAVTDKCSDKTGTLTQGKMVTKKAWIPARGTYSVETSHNPFNPDAGRLSHSPRPPSQMSVGGDGTDGNAAYTELLHDNKDLENFLNAAAFANIAHVHKGDDGWIARGDPTDIAIQVFASRFDWNRERFTSGNSPKWIQTAEFPFDSNVKKMSVIFKHTNGQHMVFTKGAVERVLASCTYVKWDYRAESRANHDLIEMTNFHKNLVLENMEVLAAQGLRVLALASKPWSGSTESSSTLDRSRVEECLTFQGLVGIYDPPRPESAGAVKACHEAGISVHMLTGDHPGTARTIAGLVGILPENMSSFAPDVNDAMVMTASTFDKLSDDDIDELPVLPLVIARCTPNTKVRMIEALHRRDCFAAMTGDGVNDSPSLKRADVGIAMGQAGSDVAKDASDIVLTDDNFASIIRAVEEGRRMFDNIQKFILHLLAQNIAQARTLLIGLAFKDDSGLSVFPLAPVQILWIIMVTSGMPDMGLGVEVAAPNIMIRPPQSLKTGVFTMEVMVDMLAYGFWMAALCICAFSLVLFGFGDGNLGSDCNEGYSSECDTVFRARATTFVCLTWFSLFLAWEMMNMRRSFFRMQPESKKYFTQWMYDVWRNQFLFWAIIAGFITIFPTIYIPVINQVVFKHTGISWEWGIVFVEAVLFVGGIEAWKWTKRVFFRRRANGKAETNTRFDSPIFSKFTSTNSRKNRAIEGQISQDIEKGQ